MSFIVLSGHSQNIKRIYKAIKNNELEDAISESSKTDSKTKFDENENILFNLSQCLLQSNPNSTVFKPYEASNLFKSISIIKVDEINEYLNKYNLNLNKIQEFIYAGVVFEAKKENTESSYTRALEVCKLCSFEKELIDLRILCAYNNCKKINNVDGFNNFLKNYPSNKFSSEIGELFCQLIYDKAKTLSNKNHLQKLLINITRNKNLENNNFCQNKAQEIRDLCDSLSIIEIGEDYEGLKKFTIDFPNSKYTSKVIQKLPDVLYKEVNQSNSFTLMKSFIQEFPNDSRSVEIKEKLEKTKYFEISINEANNCNDCTYKLNGKIFDKIHSICLENEKFGVIDLKTGKAIIPFKYDEIVGTSITNIAKGLINGKWGLIDNKGNEITRFIYDNISSDFLDGYSVMLNNKFGIIDVNGKEIIPNIYEDIYSVSFNNNEENDFNKYKSLFYNDIIAVKLNNKWGYLNRNNINITPIIYDTIKNFNEEVAIVGKYIFFGKRKKLMYGLVNKNGKEITSLSYDNIVDYNGGIAAVEITEYFEVNKNNRKEGEEAKITFTKIDYSSINYDEKIDLLYCQSGKVEDDKYIAKSKYIAIRKWGYIDNNGKIIIPIQYAEAYNFVDGIAKICNAKLTYSSEYGYVYLSSHKYRLINNKGESVSKEYEDIRVLRNGFARVKQNGNWGLVNMKGEEITPLIYEDDYLGYFINGFSIAIEKKNKLTLINKFGKPIVSQKVEIASIVSNDGYIIVTNNNKFGVIDTTGKVIIDCIYEGILNFSNISHHNIKETSNLFENDFLKAKIKGKWGYIDKTGKTIIPFKYDNAENFRNGIASVTIGNMYDLKNCTYYLIDTTGKILLKAKHWGDSTNGFQYNDFMPNGLGIIPLNKKGISCIGEYYGEVELNYGKTNKYKYGFFDNFGNQITPMIYNGLATSLFNDFAIVIEINSDKIKILWFNVD